MAIRDDFTAGEVLAAADLNDTFGSKANLASPTFTGTPAAPTAAAGTNTTQLATTAFVQGAGGLVLIASESFSAVSSVSINGCFSSTYDNYFFAIRLVGSTSLVLNYRFRTGSDDSSTNYFHQEFTSSSTSNTGTRTSSANSGRLAGLVGTDEVLVSGVIGSPNLARTTNLSINTNDQAGFSLALLSGAMRTSTQYTGITLIASTGNITGLARIYGYKNS